MRTVAAVGVAFLALMGCINVAEARARLRLSLGRMTAPQRLVTPAPTPAPAAASAPAGFSGRIGYRPAIAITSGQVAVAAAAPTVPLATSGDSTAGADRPATMAPSVVTPASTPPHIREVRAIAPPCESGKRVGGVEREDDGFCLVN